MSGFALLSSQPESHTTFDHRRRFRYAAPSLHIPYMT